MYGAALVGRISRAAIFHNTDPALCDANYSNPNRSSESICDHFKQVGSGPSSAPYSLTVDFGFLLSFAVVCSLSFLVSKVFHFFTSKKDDPFPSEPSVHDNNLTNESTDALKPALSDSNMRSIESDFVNEVQGTSGDLTDNSPQEKVINSEDQEISTDNVKADIDQTVNSVAEIESDVFSVSVVSDNDQNLSSKKKTRRKSKSARDLDTATPNRSEYNLRSATKKRPSI